MGAAWLLFMIWVDMFWLTQPTMAHAHAAAGEHGGLTFHMMDVTLFLGFGAFFVSALISRLVSAPMVAVGDPRIKESIAFENF